MTQIARHRRDAAYLGLVLLVATACADRSTPSTTPPSASSPDVAASESPAPGDTWLAALHVDPDPNALDADTRALKEILGGALLVTPASCLRGLPPEVESTAYLLGVQASTRTELHSLIAETERDPLFEVRVQVLCTD